MDKKKPHLKLVGLDGNESIIPGLLDVISKLTIRNHELFSEIIKTAMLTLEAKDEYTKGHSVRVTEYSKLIGEALNFSENEMWKLELSALLHDIGKIGVPDKILKKPGRLTNEEYEVMKQHPLRSEKIIASITGLTDIAPIIRSHHERYDGYGYPDGLKGEDIPLYSRIILIADTFDAMTSTRPYRKELSDEISFEELRKFSGSQFDPRLVEIFIQAMQSVQYKKAG